MRFKRHSDSLLEKKARRGFRGYPVATIAFYGPDDKKASKVAVGIVTTEGVEPIALERWFAEDSDVRTDPVIADKILQCVRVHGAMSVVMTDGIIAIPMRRESIIRKGECARSVHSGRTATAGLAMSCSSRLP